MRIKPVDEMRGKRGRYITSGKSQPTTALQPGKGYFPVSGCLVKLWAVTVVLRILTLLLSLFVAGPLSVSARAGVRPETRVGGSPGFSSVFASPSASQAAEPHQENPGCGYDFAPAVHKYLYCAADPVNRIDPSGHESLPSLMTGFTIKAIGFRMLVGSAVGVWDANFRGYSQWEGLAYGAVGGAIGPIIPWQLGITLTGYGIGEALTDGDYDSAIFRGATAVVGVGSMRWAKSLPGGRLGNLNTQLQNSKLALYLQSKGWKIRNGGGQGGEERIPPPGGGRNGETWVDITAEKNGRILRVQTVDTLANGAPTPRELNAASRIRAAFPGDKLLLVPKADAGGAASTTPPLFRGPEDDDQ